jgi:hypothetical protein
MTVARDEVAATTRRSLRHDAPDREVEMSRTCVKTLVVLGVLLCMSVAVPGAADASHGCRASTSSGSRILDQSEHGVVFFKRGNYYGCLSSVGTARRLPTVDGYRPVQPMRTEGRYVTYVAERTEGTNPTKQRLVVFDLRRDEPRVSVDAHSLREIGGTVVESFVLKRNGSIAWIGSGARGVRAEEPLPLEVHKLGVNEGAADVIIDSGPNVDRRSLALAYDNMRLYWLNGGEVRTSGLN